MNQENYRFYLFSFIIFSLSFPSSIETNVNNGIISEQLNKFIQFDKYYDQIYTVLKDQVDSIGKTTEILGKNDILIKQMKEKLEYLPKSMEKFNKLDGKIPSSNPIKDIFQKVETGLLVNFNFAFVETGLMINELLNTCDTIKKSKQFRESNILQKTTIKIQKYLDDAQEFLKRANNELNKIATQSDISVKENLLRQINLDLRGAEFECQRAQEVLKNVLKDIQQTQESLSSAKKYHSNGLWASVFRFFYSIYDIVTNPISYLMNIKNVISSLIAAMNFGNIIGHAHGYYWTRDEIQKLEIYQHQFNELEDLIKYSTAKINLGFEIYEQLKKTMFKSEL